MLRFIILFVTLISTSAWASVGVRLSSAVDDSWVEAVAFASVIARVTGETQVDLTIDSPGGAVDSAVEVMHQMEQGRAVGLTYRCFVDGFAMSAAFFVLTACDERTMTRRSLLLWHEMWLKVNPSMFVPTIREGFLEFMQAAATQQLALNTYIAERMRIKWDALKPYYDEEKVISSYTIVDLAPGFISVGTK